MRKSLIELLTLMAIYDGNFVNKEREFLIHAAEILSVPLDIEQVEKRTKEYQIIVEKNVFEKTAEAMGSAAVTAIGTAGQTASKLKNALEKVVKRDGSAAPSVSSTQIQNDPVERLKKLSQMLEAGLISQIEHDAKKAEILSAL